MRHNFAVSLLFVVLIAIATTTVQCLEGFDAEDNLDVAVQEFQEWFTKRYNGEVKVRLGVAGEGMRIGVFATTKIAAESKYLAIPTNMIIGEQTIFPTPVIGPILKSMQRSFPMDRHQATLAVFLMYEKFIMGRQSEWYQYIRLIPAEHDVPYFYEDEELDLLRGTSVPTKVHSMRNEVRQNFHNMRQSLFNKHKEVFPAHTFNYDNWAWAMGILNTRMIWWDNAPHLVPMLDMINCRQGPKYRERRVHSTQRQGDRAVTLAPWAFEEGDQVFENYGQPNPTYFLYHGFVMEPNVHDCAHTKFLTDRVSEKHRRKMQQFRVWRDEYCVTPDRYSEMLIAARIAAAADSEFNDLKSAPNSRLSIHNERRALKLMGDSIRTQLEQFHDHNPYWREDLEKEDRFRHRMITTFRETQGSMLNQTLGVLRKAFRRIPKQKHVQVKRDGTEPKDGIIRPNKVAQRPPSGEDKDEM